MTFGTKLRKLRESKNISQKEISLILEVSQTIYGKWESDRFFPTYKNLKKLASFYKINVDFLVQTEVEISKGEITEKKRFKKKYLKEILRNIKELKTLIHTHFMHSHNKKI
ncbi:helix-turn-helix domain-containing protein [Flavobacterium sp. 245]|uniref:helix-turn-helix domain-containing protein n=1 Tax=Flavobacterium sp. 245 TaxID=2512115 RepID=UPI00105EB445|nr:helix-turn-helix transcriptional regulator [Flavobacterium sp. 245]TDP04002.1 helix-turn-helix protein [Flavobacterium sp. 245]